MRALPESFAAYAWAPSTEELARRAGLDPFEIVRFDGNTRTLPHPSARPGTIARALAEVNGYAHGGHVSLTAAVAEYAGVEPENVVLGAGADDLILLCARAFAGPGDRVAIANEPTYPLYATAIRLAGAEVGDDDPVLTFCCRPNNPTGELVELPAARPLVVDEAYFEYAGETAAGLIEDGVVVLRTFSKAFALAGARVGYALASREVAAELNARQAPLPVSTLSAALAVAALADPPDLSEEIAERERLASGLRALGLEPLPSHTNFVFVPMDGAGGGRRGAPALGRRPADPSRRAAHHRPGRDRRRPPARRARARSRPACAGGCSRRPANAAAPRYGRDAHARPARAGRRGAGARCPRERACTTTCSSSSRSTQASISILEGTGDLETGEHHTAEGAALALGEALDRALGDRSGIARSGDAVVQRDDALARAAVDLGRPVRAPSSASSPRRSSPVTSSRVSRRRGGWRSTSRRADEMPSTWPRRRSGRSGGRCARPRPARPRRRDAERPDERASILDVPRSADDCCQRLTLNVCQLRANRSTGDWPKWTVVRSPPSPVQATSVAVGRQRLTLDV